MQWWGVVVVLFGLGGCLAAGEVDSVGSPNIGLGETTGRTSMGVDDTGACAAGVDGSGGPQGCGADTDSCEDTENPPCAAPCDPEVSECGECGNGVVDPGETCDDKAFDGQTCVTLGYEGGTLICTLDCREVIAVNCAGTPGPGGGPGGTSGSDGDTGIGSDSDGGSSGGPPPGPPYTPCVADSQCPENEHCVQLLGYCSPYCESDGECPAAIGGEAIPACDETSSTCYLLCDPSVAGPCPMAMTCLDDSICSR